VKKSRLTQALQDEIKQVSFSDEKKQRLAMKLRQAMHAGAALGSNVVPGATALEKPNRKSTSTTWWTGVAGRATAFWNGTTEISVPTAAAALLLVGIGMWGQLSSLFLVDQSVAALMIQAGSDMETASIISQGVSLL
jgi:hypothetical protein